MLVVEQSLHADGQALPRAAHLEAVDRRLDVDTRVAVAEVLEAHLLEGHVIWQSEGEPAMTQTLTSADVVRRGYQAFNEADINTINRLWRDHVTWTTPGEHGLGHGRGKGCGPGPVRPLPPRTSRQATRHDVLHRVEVEDGQIKSGTEHFFDLHNWDQF